MGAARDAVLAEIDKMSEPQIERVLAAIRGSGRLLGPGMTGKDFVERFGGLIPVDELDRMDAAVERDCETVEPDDGV